jgi:hypothetical protein
MWGWLRYKKFIQAGTEFSFDYVIAWECISKGYHPSLIRPGVKRTPPFCLQAVSESYNVWSCYINQITNCVCMGGGGGWDLNRRSNYILWVRVYHWGVTDSYLLGLVENWNRVFYESFQIFFVFNTVQSALFEFYIFGLPKLIRGLEPDLSHNHN